MDKIVVATPLRNGVCSKPYTFSHSVAIREIRPILWELSAAKGFLSGQERERLEKAEYWLSVTEDVQSWVLSQSDPSLYDKARLAMYALQIICPKGGQNIYMKFNETPDGFDNIASFHPAQMDTTLMGRVTVLEQQGLVNDFDDVFRGVSRAFDEKVVRLQNPILLLEHGLQTRNVYLSTLMWVMGLDMLFMAGELNPFVERLVGFLGRGSFVFPSIPFPDRQPALTVGAIVEDVYKLRNTVAHGQEIPKTPFRERRDIVDTDGVAINTTEYGYAQVIQEASLFLLTKSLRKILVEGLVDVVKDETNWKQMLKTGARLEQQRAASSVKTP